MSDVTLSPEDVAAFARVRQPRDRTAPAVAALLALAGGAVAAAWMLDAGPARTPRVATAPAPSTTRAEGLPPAYLALLDPAFSLGVPPSPLGQNGPLAADFTGGAPSAVAAVAASPSPPLAPLAEETSTPEEPTDAPAIPLPLARPAVVAVADDVPLPTPRPSELAAPIERAPFRPIRRAMTPRMRMAAPAAPPPDNRGFFEKLFGALKPSGPALAYAAPESGFFGGGSRLTSAPIVGAERYTAVYDIAAHTVTMPDGTRLEAHSGLGDKLDDPRQVHVRNRGATPPHVYDLEPRAQLFHGVRALRLNPVGGGSVFGRNGLLAHTYMLGPNGQSNGCVSFRDYEAFLRAYSNGQIRRLAVVAGR